MYIHSHCTPLLSCPTLCFQQALFGVFLFGESVSLLWWFGASLVVVGLVITQHGARDNVSDTPSEYDHNKIS